MAFLRPPRAYAQKKTGHASEQNRPDVLSAHEAWFDGQLDLDPETLVFVDETGASTKMSRRYGRALRGERLRMAVPHGHWMTTTFVGGLRLSGMTAPLVIDGSMTRAWFEAWVAQALAPTLKPGDVVIPDNLPAHKSIAAREAIEAKGTRLLFLPPPAFARAGSTRQTLIRSKTPLPSSRRSCAKRLREPSVTCPAPSAPQSIPSPQLSAPTTSPLPDTMRTDRNLL